MPNPMSPAKPPSTSKLSVSQDAVTVQVYRNLTKRSEWTTTSAFHAEVQRYLPLATFSQVIHALSRLRTAGVIGAATMRGSIYKHGTHIYLVPSDGFLTNIEVLRVAGV